MKWYHIFATAMGVLLVGLGLAIVLYFFGPQVEERPAEPLIPLVEYIVAAGAPHRPSVRTQGLVSAATEANLVSEVSGRIIAVSPNFDAGGFFEEGDILLRIDPTSHEAALAEARVRLATARLALEQEEATRAQVEQDWRELGRGKPTELALRQPQRERAQAEIEAAESALAVARRNMAQTSVRAPFAGQVRETMVDLGDVVTANATRLAAFFGVASAEVRLPLTLHEIGLLELPEVYRGENAPVAGPPVALSGEYGGRRHTWTGTIERVEGVIDPRTRLVYAVAAVTDPYRRKAVENERPPLKIGLFVEAMITGRRIERAFVLPRAVMVGQNDLFIIDADNRLFRRKVEIVHTDTQNVVIIDGISEGERINLTPIDFFIEGMTVSPQAVNPRP